MASKSYVSLCLSACLCVFGAWTSGCVLSPRPTSYEANNQVLALNQVVVFQDSSGALSYHAPTGHDVRVKVATRVRGRACQHGIQLPLPSKRSAVVLSAGWGQGAYQEALTKARRNLPSEAVLFDLRADLSHLAILTLYRRMCLVVDAAVALPVPPAIMIVPVPPAAPIPMPPHTPVPTPPPPLPPEASLSVPHAEIARSMP